LDNECFLWKSNAGESIGPVMLRRLCATSILLPINLSTRLGVVGTGLEHLERLVVGHIRELD
jgi:hypothetical protein